MAEDPIQVAPDVYRVLLENDRVRVLEVREAPGAGSAMHGHPDYVVYGITAGTVRFTGASGESAEIRIGEGEVMWRDAEEHATENVGSGELRALLVELK